MTSASWPQRILRNPVPIEVAARNATAERVEQHVYRVPKEHKRHLLAHLIERRQLAPGAGVHAHQARRQPAHAATGSRTASAPRRFTATRARARACGPWRISRPTASPRWWPPRSPRAGSTSRSCRTSSTTSLPNVPEDYVHRIGRTARAGGAGCAVSLVSPGRGPSAAGHRAAAEALPAGLATARISDHRWRKRRPS